MSKKTKKSTVEQEVEMKPIRLDFGCGPNKLKEANKEFIGVDSLPFVGVDVVLDLTAKEKSVQNPDFSVTHTYKKWPWEDNSVDEIHCSHFLEHLSMEERCHFMNEVYRILKPGAQCRVIVPHWASSRAYGDCTHNPMPVSEFYFYYLSKEWRAGNAPHTVSSEKYPNLFNSEVNFVATWGYTLNQALLTRNQEYQSFALANFKEAAQDIVATLTKS